MNSKAIIITLSISLVLMAICAASFYFLAPRYYPSLVCEYSPILQHRFITARDYMLDDAERYDEILSDKFTDCIQWLPEALLHNDGNIRYITRYHIAEQHADSDEHIDALFRSYYQYRETDTFNNLLLFKHKAAVGLFNVIKNSTAFERSELVEEIYIDLDDAYDYDWSDADCELFETLSVDDLTLFSEFLKHEELAFLGVYALLEFTYNDMDDKVRQRVQQMIGQWYEYLQNYKSGTDLCLTLFPLLQRIDPELSLNYLFGDPLRSSHWIELFEEADPDFYADQWPGYVVMFIDRAFEKMTELDSNKSYFDNFCKLIIHFDIVYLISEKRFYFLFEKAKAEQRDELTKSMSNERHVDVYLTLLDTYPDHFARYDTMPSFDVEDQAVRDKLCILLDKESVSSPGFRLALRFLNKSSEIEISDDEASILLRRLQACILAADDPLMSDLLVRGAVNSELLFERLVVEMQSSFKQNDIDQATVIADLLIRAYRELD